MRSKLAVGTCALLALAASGCGRGSRAPEAARAPRLALVLKTLNSPFFIEMQKGAQDEAKRRGAELIVQAAEREVDVDKQMQIIENLIETGVSALLITPSGSREVVPAIAKANQAGIPVVVVDTKVDEKAAQEAGVRVDSFIGSDNVEGGRVAGRRLVELTGGKASVAIVEGIPGHETGDSRIKGFKEAIAAAPGVKVVVSQTANWERDQAYSVAQNMLHAHPEIDALFACNDVMALGAIEAIAAAGKTGKIRVIGFDAIDEARKAMEAGTMAASVAQYPVEMGRLAVETALRRVKGESVPAEQTTKIGLVTRETARETGS